jgi:hypothetical protein
MLAAFWSVGGLVALRSPLICSCRLKDVKLKAVASEEALRYQGLLLVPGIIAVGATGVFT